MAEIKTFIENNIWIYRDKLGLKQREIAFLLNQKDTTQFSRYERGLVLPDFEKVYKIAYILKVKFEEFKELYPIVDKWEKEVDERYSLLEKVRQERKSNYEEQN